MLRGELMKKKISSYIFWIVFVESVGILSGWLSQEGIELYNKTAVKPPLSPPAIVFPVVWGILFLLMGVGIARVRLNPPSQSRGKSLVLFLAQLAVNFSWSLIFFNCQAFDFAFFWLLLLWALVVWMTVMFSNTDRTAALLQLPYVIWLTFASCLSAGVWALNG